MFLCRNVLLLARKLLESAADAETGVPRLDNVVDVSLLGCLVRVAEEILIFLFLFLFDTFLLVRILYGLDVLGVKDSYGSVCTHHGNLG